MINNQKTITIRGLAKEAGVSVATVSRTLRKPETVAAPTRMRILKLIEEHRFVPDGRAATFSSKRTGIVGLIVPTISNSIYAAFTEAIQSALQEAGLSLLIANTNYSNDVEHDIIYKFIESRVEGVILTGYQRSPSLYKMLRHYEIPFVVTWSTSPTEAVPAISFSNADAAAEAVEKLMDLGHRRVGLICGTTHSNDRAAQRLAAYQAVLARHGVAYDPALVAEIPFEIEVAVEAATRLISTREPPTALFCANDIQAMGALFACSRQGLRVPADISIIGFDDLPSTRVVSPSLSTVHVPARRMGEEAARAIVAAARQDVPVCSRILPTRLIIRESVSAYIPADRVRPA